MDKEQPNTENGNSPKTPSKGSGSTLGLIILLAGIIIIIGNVYYYINNRNAADLHQKRVDSLSRDADTASARFEIGYGTIGIDLYKKMKASAKEKDLLVYPIIKNEIDERIISGKTGPDQDKMISSKEDSKKLAALYKQKALKLLNTGVICLIVKQISKGKAENVILDVNYVNLKEVVEMYDPLDIGTDDFPASWRRVPYDTVLRQINLGTMDTGSSWLVPLYISNQLFYREHEDPPGWIVTTGPIYVPLTLNYSQKRKKPVKLSLAKVLTRPIDISQ